MAKTILVTGANGYIGTHTIKLLEKHSDTYKIIATGRKDQKKFEIAKFIPYDLFNTGTIDNIYDFFEKPDIVIHLAWQNGFDHNNPSHCEDWSSHFKFIKQLIDSGVKHIIIAGSFREYGKCNGLAKEKEIESIDNLYCLSKLMLKKSIELYIKNKPICFQWIRPFSIYGDDKNNCSILSKIITWEKEGRLSFPFTDGTEKYDYLHISELAQQIVTIANQTDVTGVIDCCSGNPVQLSTVVNKFLKENNFKIKPEYGAFKRRDYDSTCIYGDVKKIQSLMNKKEKNE